jgi:hypothetical protein
VSIPCLGWLVLLVMQVKAAIDTAPHLAWEAQALGLIDAQLYRDQARKLVARLHEAASSSPPGARALATAAVASGGRWQTPELLQRLLREPDAAPSKPLRHVSVARYAAALEQQRKEREAEQRREHGLARLLQLLGMPAVLLGQLRAQLGLEEGGDAEPAAAAQEQGQGQQGAAAQPTIALLTLTGPIYLGNGPSAGLGPAAARQPGHRIASLPVIASLRAARHNPAVRAVVLRIDSPGACLHAMGRTCHQSAAGGVNMACSCCLALAYQYAASSATLPCSDAARRWLRGWL